MKVPVGRPAAASAIVTAAILLSLLGSSLHSTSAYSNSQSASLVIGQTSFSGDVSAPSQSGLHAPSGITFDSSGNLWVADRVNNRTLEYAHPFTSGESASLVIGQSDFNSAVGSVVSAHNTAWPTGVAFDSSGNLWIADRLNNRILKFVPPFSSGMSATTVIGQTDFVSSAGYGITTSSSFYHPRGITFDSSGNLWVADGGNDRVLEFAAPLVTGMSATLVIGQSDFSSYGYSTSSARLNIPFSVAFDKSGSLWVSDEFNNRTLAFSRPFSTGMSASIVIGQSSFTTSAVATTQSGLNSPLGLAFDSSGNLWIADQDNSRLLSFSPPLSSGMPASLVLGQPSFTAGACPSTPTSSSLCYTADAAFDSSGNLWVSDQGNNRVLEFTGAGTTTTSTTTTSTAPSTTTVTATSTTTVTATTTQVSTTTATVTSRVTSTVTATTTATTTATATQSVTATSTETTTSTLPVTTTTSVTVTSVVTSTTGGGAVPELPLQSLATATFVVLVVAGYLASRAWQGGLSKRNLETRAAGTE